MSRVATYKLSILFALFIALSISLPTFGQDAPVPEGMGDSPSARDVRVTSSQFRPPQTNDSVFVVDSGPDLDTSCRFNDQSPLRIQLPVDRYVGSAAMVKKMISQGLAKPFAKLTIPAYDVDFSGSGYSGAPERDRVLFNGRPVPEEYLQGSTDIWHRNTFNIPLDWVLFPEDPGAGGGAPTPRINTITVQIDVLNTSQVWCTAVDWVSLEIEVARPILLVHGIGFNSNPSVSWNEVWKPKLKDEYGVLSETINLSTGLIALDSIQNNAGKIAAKVQSLKTKWGVDKLNIVSHSKGGLDSREFIQNSSDIDILVQMGTPNGGSPVADYVQGAVLGGTVALCRVYPAKCLSILNAYKKLQVNAPAGVQLTVTHMTIYNWFYRQNPETDIYSVAGNYKHGGIGGTILDGILWALMFGDSDRVVPTWSVYELEYATHLPQITAKPDANHTDQIESQIFFYQIVNQVLRQASGTRNSQPLSLPAPANVTRNTATPFTVAVGEDVALNETVAHVIPVDSSNAVAFLLTHIDGTLAIELVSPSGTRYTKASVTGSTTANYRVLENAVGSKSIAFSVANPEVGNWTVEITGKKIVSPDGVEFYLVQGVLEGSSVSMTALPNQDFYKTGQTITVTADLDAASTPVLGATVELNLMLPDENLVSVVMNDSGTAGDSVAGDGIYSGQYVPTQTGYHKVVVTATGPLAVPFSRQVFFVTPVSANGTDFNNSFSSAGFDSNANGLFDALNFNVGLTVGTAGSYSLMAELRDSNSTLIDTAKITPTLAAGSQTVTLAFSGERIFDNRVNGPYTITLTRLAQHTDVGPLPINERVNPHVTAAFNFNQFERASEIYLNNTVSISTIDSDGDGKYDLLRGTTSVYVPVSATHTWSARLVDNNGRLVALGSNSAYLTAGNHTITIDFSGRDIFNKRKNGVYTIRDFLVYTSTRSVQINETFDTPEFKFSDFEFGELLVNGSFEAKKSGSSLPNLWTGADISQDKRVCSKKIGTANPVLISVDGLCAFLFKGNKGDLIQTVKLKDIGIFSGDVLYLEAGVRAKSYPISVQVRATITYVGTKTKTNMLLDFTGYYSTTSYSRRYTTATLANYPIKKITLKASGKGGTAYLDAVKLRQY